MPNDWSYKENHVLVKDTLPGEFMSSESTFIAAGPDKFDKLAGPIQNIDHLYKGDVSEQAVASAVYPIGVVENMGISQNKQVQRIFEIGSSVSYFIPGRSVGAMNLSRVQFHGDSLLRVLYGSYGDAGASSGGEAPFFTPRTGSGIQIEDIKSNPGYGNYFINLGSDLFNFPFGMMVYMADQQENPIAAFYAEICQPVSHQTSVSAGSILIMEGVAFQFERIVPINVQDVYTIPSAA